MCPTLFPIFLPAAGSSLAPPLFPWTIMTYDDSPLCFQHSIKIYSSFFLHHHTTSPFCSHRRSTQRPSHRPALVINQLSRAVSFIFNCRISFRHASSMAAGVFDESFLSPLFWPQIARHEAQKRGRKGSRKMSRMDADNGRQERVARPLACARTKC